MQNMAKRRPNMKIGVYGGTFNPPHMGHFKAARAAVSVLKLDKLILIPAAIPPHKSLPADSATAEERLAMTQYLADSLLLPGQVEVSAMEIERGGQSYSAQTLRELSEQYSGAEFWLLVGTDMFLTLHLWQDAQAVMHMAGICTFGRTEQDSESVFAPQREFLSRTYQARVTVITLPRIVDVSSTRLREVLSRGGGGEYLLPPVYGYILRTGLYGTDANLKRLEIAELRACSLSMVRAKRHDHILGVEEEAVRLARRWGADTGYARRAGILHDCTKYWTGQRHKQLCKMCGQELDELEQQTEKLLHAKSGACIARTVFGEPDEVYDAILWHTTGKPDMTLLEKILYVADYMEPNREFEGVDRLRDLAYTDLDSALLLGLEMTVLDMEVRCKRIHPMTWEARNWLKAHGVTIEEVEP